MLAERWAKEEEERKRKQEEEEENKFDFNSFMLETKKQVGKKTTKQGFKNRVGGNSSNNNAKNGGIGSRQLKAQGSGIVDSSSGTKRKTGMTKR